MDAAFLDDLQRPEAYDHPCEEIRLVETHISWVLLTGPYAYKLKKPVDYGFLDFSTFERRRHFCEEELRCNRNFAPELYLGVVPIRRRGGHHFVGGSGEVVEHAVQMVQFDRKRELDYLVEHGEIEPERLREFGLELSGIHGRLPVALDPSLAEAERIWAPQQHNLDLLMNDPAATEIASLAAELRSWSRQRLEALIPLAAARSADGRYRECHGDLHLSNIVVTDAGVRAFDCLEFEPALRWIDTVSDLAFLYMDCHFRHRADLAYAFLDGYLHGSGDYDGMQLLPFYAVYRSLVRAKVALLAARQREAGERRELDDRVRRHVQWAHDLTRRPPGRVIVMCGLSGSGKSWVAERLLSRLPAIRLRSDVIRKQQAGVPAAASTGSAVDAGLYSPERSDAVYEAMLDHALALALNGEHVILDAAYLSRERRDAVLRRCDEQGLTCRLLLADAPVALLEQRIRDRAATGQDPSEATVEVLRRQLERFQRPDPTERAIVLDTGGKPDLSEVVATILASG